MYSGINATSNRRSVRRRPNHPRAFNHNYQAQPSVPSVPVNLPWRARVANNLRIALHCVRRVIFGSSDAYDDLFDDFDVQVLNYKPCNLDDLCRKLDFSRDEVKEMYRGFKEACPAGVVDEERFRDLFKQLFPLGDANPYATFVFSALDTQGFGYVTFEQLIMFMSVLLRGSMEQKLRWIFNLYDTDSRGYLTKLNFREMIAALHQLIGPHGRPPSNEEAVALHAQRLFTKFDLNQDGRITYHEFAEACQKDPIICRSMTLFGGTDSKV